MQHKLGFGDFVTEAPGEKHKTEKTSRTRKNNFSEGSYAKVKHAEIWTDGLLSKH